MKSSSSAWTWFSILLVSLFMTQQTVQAACDEDFKAAIIDEFRRIIESQMANVDNRFYEFKNLFESGMKHIDYRFDETDKDLALVKVNVHSIGADISAITGRSSEAQLNVRSVKLMQEKIQNETLHMRENITDEFLNIREKFDYFDESIDELKDLNNNTLEELQSIGYESIQMLQNITIYVDEIKNSTMFMEENMEELNIMKNETKGLIHTLEKEVITLHNENKGRLQNIEEELKASGNVTRGHLQNIEEELMTSSNVTRGHLQNIEEELITSSNVTKGLLQNIEEELITSSNVTIELLYDIEQDTDVLYSSCEGILNKTIGLEQNINEVKLMSEETTNKITDKLASSITGLNDELQLLKDTLYEVNEKLNPERCTVAGGFMIGTQCFKIITDQKRTWDEANKKCLSEDLFLAEPTDNTAARLRKYLLDNYGRKACWLGARGTGSKFVWQHSGRSLLADDPLWDDDSTGAMTNARCLELDVVQSEWKDAPDQPYDNWDCTYQHWTLCQVV